MKLGTEAMSTNHSVIVNSPVITAAINKEFSNKVYLADPVVFTVKHIKVSKFEKQWFFFQFLKQSDTKVGWCEAPSSLWLDFELYICSFAHLCYLWRVSFLHCINKSKERAFLWADAYCSVADTRHSVIKNYQYIRIDHNIILSWWQGILEQSGITVKEDSYSSC